MNVAPTGAQNEHGVHPQQMPMTVRDIRGPCTTLGCQGHICSVLSLHNGCDAGPSIEQYLVRVWVHTRPWVHAAREAKVNDGVLLKGHLRIRPICEAHLMLHHHAPSRTSSMAQLKGEIQKFTKPLLPKTCDCT